METEVSAVEVSINDIVREVGLGTACSFFLGSIPMSIIRKTSTSDFFHYCLGCAENNLITALLEALEYRLTSVLTLETKERIEDVRGIMSIISIVNNVDEVMAMKSKVDKIFIQTFGELFVSNQVAAICIVLRLNKKHNKEVLETILRDYPFTVVMDQ